MRVLSESAGSDWLREHGLPETDAIRLRQPRAFRIEGEPAAGCTALARGISLTSHFPALLWIDETDIWDSMADLPLIESLRASLGESGRFEDCRVRLFEEGDRSVLFDFLSLTLYFAWGAVLYEALSGRSWAISHDGFIWILGKEDGTDGEAVAMLRQYGFAEVGP